MIEKKQAVVIHSGGMDSSLCLALAIKKFSPQSVVSLSFSYSQRHSNELQCAKKICSDWGVQHKIIPLDFLSQITDNALINDSRAISHGEGESPTTLVVGRNGLMARLGAIYAHHVNAGCIYMGVLEREEANSGYRDCSRRYMDLMEEILRIDLANPSFKIMTPLVHMTKAETLYLAKELNLLEYLLTNTITCYRGLPKYGCEECPACLLRNEGLKEFKASNPHFPLPY